MSFNYSINTFFKSVVVYKAIVRVKKYWESKHSNFVKLR